MSTFRDRREREMQDAIKAARCPHCHGDLSNWEHPVAVLVIKREAEAAERADKTLEKALTNTYAEGQTEGYNNARAESGKARR